MRLGLFGINMDVLALEPAAAVAVAMAAEESGWESVWAGEHYVLPDPRQPPSPVSPDRAILDPFVALTNVAAHTTKLLLGTGLTVLPYHRPLVLAKQVASLDRVADGRFLFGVGVGYLVQEFEALDVAMAGRGERTEDYLDAMHAVWTQAPAAHQGRYVRFDGVRAEPRPVRGAPPTHFGGGVAATFRRAVTMGRGWYGFGLGLAEAAGAIAALRQAERDHPRPTRLGPLEISVTPASRLPVDDQTVSAFAELGVTRLVPLPPPDARHDVGRIIDFVRTVGARYGEQAPDTAGH